MDGLTPQAILIIAAIAGAVYIGGAIVDGVKAVGHHAKGAIVRIVHPHRHGTP